LEEGDVQIRGFKLRLPLDILFVFTANPEDYTNRGSIVTPLKDRIQSQILTHYPKTLEIALAITEQEAELMKEQKEKVSVSDLVKRLIEQVAFEARTSEFVDKKSGCKRKALLFRHLKMQLALLNEGLLLIKKNKPRFGLLILLELFLLSPARIELVYEGEQEGPYQVAMNY
jgi:magnesium chelatase subunit I